MSGPNSNYAVGVSNFSGTSYYEAGNVARFNPGDIDFAFSCLFWIDGSFHSTGERNIPAQFLWGNESGNTGWSLRIAAGNTLGIGDTSGVPYLVALFGTGAAQRVAAARLSLTFGTPAQNAAPGFYKRLILATGWHRSADNSVWLSINGSPVVADLTGGAPAASLVAPRMGLSPAGSDEANFCSIVGVAFDRGVQLNQSFGVGLHGAEAWVAARGSYSHDFLSATSSIDWTHRWNVGQSVGDIGGVLVQDANGASVATPPLAPASLADVGSSGRINLGALSTALYVSGPVPAKIDLTRVGNTLTLSQEKNPVWYAGLAAGQQPVQA